MWDTGASNTSMSEAKAKRIGLLTQAGNPRQGLQWGNNITTTTADGSNFVVRTLRDVPLEIMRARETVRGTVQIMPGNASSLFGLSHIRRVKTLKVKFRDT
jgi:predicted aspartyl protease